MPTTDIKPQWHQLLHQVIEERSNNPAFAARIRRGVSKNSEHYAYGDVLAYCEKKYEETPLLRALAIVAIHPGLAHSSDHKPLGRTLLEISRYLASKRDQTFTLNPDKPDTVAKQLATLPRKNLDGAVRIINNLLSLADDSNITVDYFDLTRTLLNWGTHTSPRSIVYRKKPMQDYYRNYVPAEKLEEQS